MSPVEVLPRPRGHRILCFAVLAVCALMAIRGVVKGLRPGGNDFTIYYDSARALLAGRDPLLVQGSIYLPSFDVALMPFGILGYVPALCLWQAVSFFALIWGWRRSLELIGPRLPSRPWIPWLSLLAVSRLADSNFAYAQVNTITFALVAEGIHRWREGRIGISAIAIGLGAALKVLPGLLVFWFCSRGAWRAAAASALATAALTLVPPFVVMGPKRALDSFEHWRAQVFEPFGAGGDRLLEARDYVPGQSLTAAFYRTFSATPATSAGARGPRANHFDWPLRTTHRLVLAFSAAHLLLWAATVLRRRKQGPLAADPRFPLEAGMSVAMVLVLGPIVHKAHMVWLLLPYVALLGVPSVLRGWRRALRDGLTCLSMMLIAGTSPALLGDALATRLVSANVIFVALECALGALLIELWGPKEIAPSSG